MNKIFLYQYTVIIMSMILYDTDEQNLLICMKCLNLALGKKYIKNHVTMVTINK